MSSRAHVVTWYHEFDANFIFGNAPGSDREDVHGLSPYLAFLSIIRNNDGSKRYSLEFRGQKISGSLYYQDSGGIGSINHPKTEHIETVREPRISWEVVDEDDPIGERSGNFHITPRNPGMKTKDGKRMKIPHDLIGINVRAQGSNFPHGQYLGLFRAIAAELGVAPKYFEEVHPRSNVRDAARHVRVDRDESGGVHAVDGILERISNLLVNDRSGYTKRVRDDRIEPGYYHTATIGSKRAAELIDGHRFAKEFKHYLPKHPEAFDEDHPLYHPKIEVSYQASVDDRDSVPWSEFQELDQEVDEALVNVLQWAGLPIESDDPRFSEIYVEDAYFEAETDHRPLTLAPDPTPRIENQEEARVLTHLRDGLPGSEEAIVRKLVADGGQHSPQDLAEETGYHLDTIYRALKNNDLVEHTYGDVSLRTPYVAEQLAMALNRAEEALATAVDVGGRALEFAADEIESSSLVKWLRAHNVHVESEKDGRLKLRMGNAPGTSVDDVREALMKGYVRWVNSGRDRDRFRNATVIFNSGGQSRVLTRALPSDVAPA